MKKLLPSGLEAKMQSIISASPLQTVCHPLLIKHGLTLQIKRDDLLHADISGNKWRKLKFNLLEAESLNRKHIVSFGGAYSNHIHALAAAGFHFGFKTTGIIRGESFYASNPTLSQATRWGMELEFVDRKTYRRRHDLDYLAEIKLQYPNAIIIPEGGTNSLALQGMFEACNEIVAHSDLPINHVITATGSGGTISGLISGFAQLKQTQLKVSGVAVLKQGDYLKEVITNLIEDTQASDTIKWALKTEFHHGGYAKVSPELKMFCEHFMIQTGIPIEPIYTGKMFFALFELIEQGYFKKGDNIVALHTGGLQGLAGLKELS